MRGDSYLEYPLIVNLIEDSPVDLVWFKGYPVEDRHTKLCLDGFLDLNSYTGHKQVSTMFLFIYYHGTHTYIHTRAGEKQVSGICATDGYGKAARPKGTPVQ